MEVSTPGDVERLFGRTGTPTSMGSGVWPDSGSWGLASGGSMHSVASAPRLKTAASGTQLLKRGATGFGAGRSARIKDLSGPADRDDEDRRSSLNSAGGQVEKRRSGTSRSPRPLTAAASMYVFLSSAMRTLRLSFSLCVWVLCPPQVRRASPLLAAIRWQFPWR